MDSHCKQVILPKLLASPLQPWKKKKGALLPRVLVGLSDPAQNKTRFWRSNLLSEDAAPKAFEKVLFPKVAIVIGGMIPFHGLWALRGEPPLAAISAD